MLKLRVAVLGRLSLNTRPGNCLGLYSTFLNTFIIDSRSIFWFSFTDATTFTILTSKSLESLIGFCFQLTPANNGYINSLHNYQKSYSVFDY